MASDPANMLTTARNAIWGIELAERPRWKAQLIHALRLFYVVVFDLMQGQLSLRAMSLVYTTLLSLVPLLAISFSVLKGFGVHNQIEPLLLNLLAPLGDQGTEITSRVVEFVDNMKVGVLGAVGLGMLVYTVISLMQKIENAFNFVWRVNQSRPFARRFGDYLSVILIGPVLAFSSLGATASLTTMNLGPLEAIGPLVKAIGALVPYLLIVVAFAFVYSFMPNTKVSLRAAIIGALVAGLLWNVAGWVFAVFVVGSTKYTAIYSAFATLIFFMIWLYLSWLILLLGAAISFYVQHPEAVTIGRGEVRPGGAAREALALGFALRIAEEHLRRRDGPSLDVLSAEARVTPAAAAPVLAALERAKIVVGTADDPQRYVPAGAIENIPVKAVLDAVREADAEGGADASPVARAERVAALMAEVDRAADAALSGRSLRDVVGG